MAILCYHSVAPGWDDPVSIEPVDFELQCRSLHRRGGVIALGSVLDRLAGGASLPPTLTALTFDDGFADFAEHAVPIMRRYRLPASVYVVAQSLLPSGKPVDWITGTHPAAAPPLLDAEQIRELHAEGWEIGSHSMAHRDLTQLTEAECLVDLSESRELLSDLIGERIGALAYPFGRHAAHVRRAAARAGYTLALALPEGPEPAGRFAVPRTGIYRDNTIRQFRMKTSRWYPSVRTSALGRTAAALRHRQI